MSDQTPSELKAANTSLGDLLGEVTRDLSTLIRQEMALAKAEIREFAGKAAKGAGMLGGAAYGAGMAVLFLSIALWWALSTLIGGGSVPVAPTIVTFRDNVQVWHGSASLLFQASPRIGGLMSWAHARHGSRRSAAAQTIDKRQRASMPQPSDFATSARSFSRCWGVNA